MFIIYRLTCSNTGKSYIGYTKHSLEMRWRGHLKKVKKGCPGKLFNAIRKYGAEAFQQEILFQTDNKNEALRTEIKLITEFNTQKNGYNITPGGEGGCTSNIPRTAEWNRHISEALKGIPKSAEHKANMCGPRPSIAGGNNPFYGKTHDTETKKKIGNRPYAKGNNHYLYGKRIATSFKSGFDHPHSTSVTVNGTTYGSLTLAAKAFNMTRPRLQRWLADGKPIPPARQEETPSTSTMRASF